MILLKTKPFPKSSTILSVYSIRRSLEITLSKCSWTHHSYFSTTKSSSNGGVLENLRKKHEKDILALPEIKARLQLSNFLRSKAGFDVIHANCPPPIPEIMPPTPPSSGYCHILPPDQIKISLDAAMATFHLHVESRIASLCGKGFYTIGPCGEEMLASIGHALHPEADAMALHYRHLSVSIVRQLRLGRTLEDILLDRARGYVVSKLDPVTGGVHCAIGSARGVSNGNYPSGGDYVVTSTLASQCPPAVGRALGFSMVDATPRSSKNSSSNTKPLSFVTIGDGSVHNAHFLAAFNLARHARFRRKKCPVVFGVSDNGLSISYPTDGYSNFLFSGSHASQLKSSRDQECPMPLHGDGIPIFKANGYDMLDVYDKTFQAASFSRKHSAPSLVLYREITRRFGHAATDRQHAYLDSRDIDRMAESDVVAGGVVQAVEQFNVMTYIDAYNRFTEIGEITRHSFDLASEEPKITSREEMLERVSQPMIAVPRLPSETLITRGNLQPKWSNINQGEKPEVMRKHMTRVISEVMTENSQVVYLGEDVEHGGYYLVTDGLAKKFPGRVIDFPPDETTLLGAAMGFSQVGLVPIVEIPYSKYLDCGADMFYELAMSNWLTNKQRPNGMILRIQGFDRGVFGGNFHTHNMIPHIPPGVDVVCYSNGQDYARGFRNAIRQAQNGRVVAFVDCTYLLNLRHLHDKDRAWETSYPAGADEMGFHDVRQFGDSGKHLIVTYGNGVVTALRARRALSKRGLIASEDEIDIIDCPYISDVPDGLREALVSGKYDLGGLFFCDICKEGPGSNALSSMVTRLKTDNLLPAKWSFVAAPRTYNPLGNVVTFLNEDDIIRSFLKATSQLEAADQ